MFASLLFAAVVVFQTLTLVRLVGGLAFKLVSLVGFDPLPLMTGGAVLVRLVMSRSVSRG